MDDYKRTPYTPHDFEAHSFPTGFWMIITRLVVIGLVLLSMYFLFEPKIKALGQGVVF